MVSWLPSMACVCLSVMSWGEDLLAAYLLSMKPGMPADSLAGLSWQCNLVSPHHSKANNNNASIVFLTNHSLHHEVGRDDHHLAPALLLFVTATWKLWKNFLDQISTSIYSLSVCVCRLFQTMNIWRGTYVPFVTFKTICHVEIEVKRIYILYFR